MRASGPLIDPAVLAPVFEPLRNRRVGFLRMFGNAGDRLIDDAAVQLFEHFDIAWMALNWIRDRESEPDSLVNYVDEIVISGGGNLGCLYGNCQRLRLRYRDACKHPFTVLPQSLTEPGEDLSIFERVYLRERASLERVPGGLLAPDLALAYTPPALELGQRFELGLFLRRDRDEALFADHPGSLGDPIDCCDDALDYLELAGRFAHVVTDRLHFAIAALLTGAGATLLPNGYWKNRSMYETWLADLGCGWLDSPRGVECDVDTISRELGSRLAAPPASRLAEGSHPQERVPDATGDDRGAADAANRFDGSRTVGEIIDQQGAGTGGDLLDARRRVQRTIHERHLDGRLWLETGAGGASPAARRPCWQRAHEMYVHRPAVFGDRLRGSAHLRLAGGGHADLWFESGVEHRELWTDDADPYVIAVLMRAMADGAALIVRGAPLSAGLASRLHRYQEVIHAWFPEYRIVPVIGDERDRAAAADRPALAAFSGGVDSCFTVFRHALDGEWPWALPLTHVLVVRGFDVYKDSRSGYRAMVGRCRDTLDGTGIGVIELWTNLREIQANWKRQHGPGLGAVLSLFAGGFGHGLIGSTMPYRRMYPWSSNPLSDPMLSGGRFTVIHDGAGFTRLEKLRALSRHPRVIDRLRFCWVASPPDHNCGRCAKCLMTAIQLRVLGLPLTCIGTPPDDEEIAARLPKLALSPLDFSDMYDACRFAEREAADLPWLPALRARLSRDRERPTGGRRRASG